MSTQPDHSAEVIDLLRAIFRTLHTATLPLWMALDISMAQMKVLLVVREHGVLPVSQIAELLEIGAPTASHHIDKLVQAGLVTRSEDPENRRRMRVELSGEGQQLLQQLHQGRLELMRASLAQLDPAQIAQLAESLGALTGAMQQVAPETTSPST